MMKKLFLALLVLVALFGITTLEQWFLMPPAARAQTNTFCASNLACTVTGIWTFKYLSNVRYADGFSGADCGARINAADADLGATFGEIWVNQTCGTTWTTAVSISAGHVLRFIQGGTYTTNTIAFANWSALVGSPGSVQFVASQANTILRQANGTNGNPYIHGAGSNILFRDFAIDGNGSNNATGGADIDCLGARCQFQSISAINSPSHGLRLGDGTCCQNRGSGAKISNSHFVSNTGSGIFLNFTTDVWVMQTELDNNTRYGLEGLGIATARIIGNDVGGNTLGGILISGATAFQSNGSIIQGNEFKNNLGIDLDIESDTGAPHANIATIAGNSFQGLGGAAAANTFAAIRSNGGGANSIAGNVIQSIAPSYKYCINIAEPAGGQELADQIGINQCTGTFGTGAITTTANTHYTGNCFGATCNQTDNIIVGAFVSHDTGSQAASGFIRMSSGDTVAWRNNANSADLLLSKNASDELTWPNPAIWPGIHNFTGNTAALTADWTCGTGGIVASCVAATIIGSGGGVPLTFTLPLVAQSYTLECDGVVGQATAATANQWNLLTATNGATNVTANYSMATAATAAAFGAVTDQASTTTTFQIAPSWTLGGTATKMPFHIYAKIEGASASGTVVSLQLVAPTVADLVTIYRGAACRVF